MVKEMIGVINKQENGWDNKPYNGWDIPTRMFATYDYKWLRLHELGVPLILRNAHIHHDQPALTNVEHCSLSCSPFVIR